MEIQPVKQAAGLNAISSYFLMRHGSGLKWPPLMGVESGIVISRAKANYRMKKSVLC